jgi:hypothetical protein
MLCSVGAEEEGGEEGEELGQILVLHLLHLRQPASSDTERKNINLSNLYLLLSY